MQNKSFGKSLVIVAFSRMVSLISSVAVGFILPKILSMTDYGYFKVFTLYAVYTALLHFGFVDGILLKISGMDYKDLDPTKMRTYTRFFMVMEALISLALLAGGWVFARGEYVFIVFMLALNMLFVNVTTYYQFVSQAVQRFREYSAKNVIVAVAKLLFVVLLYVLTACDVPISYRLYLIGLNVLDFSIMLWYIVIYRDITLGDAQPIKAVANEIVSIFKIGIVLTLSYQVSHLILALDRQFVNVLFSTEDFAVYSFAYNIVSMVSTMVSSVSIVLLPMLKNRSKEAVTASYKRSLSTVSMVAAAGLLLHFPLAVFIEWFLPDYIGSITYIAIVLPAFLFTSAVTVVMFTINKVLDMNFEFLKDGCFVLILGFATNVIAYVLFRSPKAISYASLLVMMIWFIVAGLRLQKRTNVAIHRDFIYLLGVSAGFLLDVYLVENMYIGFFLYAIWLILWTVTFYRNEVRACTSLLKRKSAPN